MTEPETRDGAAVRFPPPLVPVITIIAGYVLGRFVPLLQAYTLPTPARQPSPLRPSRLPQSPKQSRLPRLPRRSQRHRRPLRSRLRGRPRKRSPGRASRSGRSAAQSDGAATSARP